LIASVTRADSYRLRGRTSIHSNQQGRTMTGQAQHRQRDARVDFFRGLALVFIFVDHIPGNALGHFTLRNFGFADAADWGSGVQVSSLRPIKSRWHSFLKPQLGGMGSGNDHENPVCISADDCAQEEA
jgi:OpgC protein